MTDRTDPESPDLVLKIHQGLTQQCEHFNKIEAGYRTLASTWLLAAFAGMGVVLKDFEPNAPILIAAVAGASAIGILLLWMLDLMVYHRLLDAAFSEQQELEARHAWLPQVAHRMRALQGGVGAVPRIVWFYMAIYTFLMAIASVALVRAVGCDWSVATQVLGMAVCFLVSGVAVACYMHSAATAREEAAAPEPKR